MISRSGSASFSDDFQATSAKVGPGQGSWLASAAAAQDPGSTGAGLVARAQRDATAWYAANTTDQAVFTSAATAGAHALDPLAGVVVAASLLMALGCAWALARRLAEYR